MQGSSTRLNKQTDDKLVALIQVLREDRKLRRQFQRVGKLPENLRLSLLGQMETQMKANGEDAGAVEAVAALRDPKICHAVRETLADYLVEDRRMTSRCLKWLAPLVILVLVAGFIFFAAFSQKKRPHLPVFGVALAKEGEKFKEFWSPKPDDSKPHAKKDDVKIKTTPTNFPLTSYDQKVVATIGACWRLLVDGKDFGEKTGEVQVSFKLLENGHVEDIQINQNTLKNKTLEKLCVRAVKESEPFDPFPDSLKSISGHHRDVTFYFYYY